MSTNLIGSDLHVSLSDSDQTGGPERFLRMVSRATRDASTDRVIRRIVIHPVSRLSTTSEQMLKGMRVGLLLVGVDVVNAA
jgi:hypothetical protein